MKTNSFSSFFDNINGIKLDKKQIKIATTKRKNVLVIAGAGSGKTLTIVSRVHYLINNLKVNPKDILCISFTNDAVNKLKEDLNIDDIDVLTFHKLALKIIGNKKEVLTEDILIDIIMDTFNNDSLYGLFKINKNDMYNLINTFISLFKSKNYHMDDFYKMINKADYKDRLLLQEIMKCYICYETYLNKENLIDFNDMINLAIEKLDYVKLNYKYIIIDEYQDTSYTKYLLIKKILEKNNASFFAVGDDFQSIYRFAGSSIELFNNFRRYFLFSKIYKLNKTYRSPYEVIKLAGMFIMKNPMQIRKKLVSNIRLLNSVQIVYYEDINVSINEIIKEDNLNNLLILARNNNNLLNIKIDKDINHRKMTVHKSKGLQSDYVFIINVNDDYNGFPNKIVDHQILKYVNKYKEYYPYEEERRLFYVALTRCKKRVYLFCKKDKPSIFVKEILKMNKNILIREK